MASGILLTWKKLMDCVVMLEKHTVKMYTSN